VYSENVPLWVAVPVVLVIVATAVVAWIGTRRAARSLLDARKATRVSFLFAAALASWLALAFLIVFLPRPE
jgi:cytochrome c-type biogenesis protein CcmH/NrfF